MPSGVVVYLEYLSSDVWSISRCQTGSV